MLGTANSHLIALIWQAIGEQVRKRMPALMAWGDSLSTWFVVCLSGHKRNDLLDLGLGPLLRHKVLPRFALMVGTKDEFQAEEGQVFDLGHQIQPTWLARHRTDPSSAALAANDVGHHGASLLGGMLPQRADTPPR
jgi:hypothetical protein